MSLVDLDSVKVDNNTDFDFDKYSIPVENLERNKKIERIQTILFSIPCIMFALLIFIDFNMWEVTAIIVIPLIVVAILELLKDKEAQEAYEEYGAWELEREELDD
jgi:hypothetical protein